MKRITFLLAIITVISCKTKKNIEEDVNPIISITTDTIWSIPNGYSIRPHLTKEGNVIYNQKFSNNPKGESIMIVNGLTGKLVHEWNDYILPGEGLTLGHYFFKDKKMIFSDGPRNYCINTETGATIWRTRMNGYAASRSLYHDGGNNYYQTVSNKDYRADIVKSDVSSGQRKIFFSIFDSTQTYEDVLVDPVILTQNSSSGNILLLKAYYRDNNGNETPMNKIFCYNMVTNKIDWIKDYEGKFNDILSNLFLSKDNKTVLTGFFKGKFHIFSISNDNGEIIWQQELPNFCVGIHLYNEQLIALSGGNNPIISFNFQTGAINWGQSFLSLSIGRLNFDFDDAIIFKNYLISTQGDYLLAISLDNGNIVCYKKLALSQAYLQYGISIDENRRLFYVQDRYRILCYHLPKEISY